eukprot:GILI01003369.1.p1 GENE.GILI01003369.1~~GILI01003369.1.p1  ORF type:complete len:303 (+),score=22.80 GILI01003369.1:121-909(+)
MCIIFFSFLDHPKYKLILASNRDEDSTRPTLCADFWPDPYSNILSGKDLKAGGTWIGVTKTGRFAALTNYRHVDLNPLAKTRGHLVFDFLAGTDTPFDFLENRVRPNGTDYNGFNLLVGDIALPQVCYFSNHSDKGVITLPPGTYGLTNGLLDEPWPKLIRGKELFSHVVKSEFCNEDLFGVMKDKFYPSEDTLPDTGVGLEWEKVVSSIFVKSDQNYQTISSALILCDQEDNITFVERTYTPPNDEETDKSFSFKMIANSS